MWVNKYQPNVTADLVGNKGNLDAIHEWLAKYKQRDPTIKRALLLTGPPGTGKTSCARIIAQEHGYKVMEFNASDTRNKKSIETLVKESSTSCNVSLLFKGGVHIPHLIVMDEVDGMSHGDRGGMNELIAIINPQKNQKNKKITNKKKKEELKNFWGAPIICIANTDHLSKLKNLITQCEVLSFDQIQDEDLVQLADKIIKGENLQITPENTQRLVEHAQGDCRRLIHILQFIAIDGTDISSDAIDKGIRFFKRKKMDITITESTECLLKNVKNGHNQRDIMQMFYNDRSLIPLMIQENFIRLKFTDKFSGERREEFMKALSLCEEMFSITDVVNQILFMYPTSSLFLDFTGLLSVFYPLHLLKQYAYTVPKSITYTLYLGNISSYSAQRKIIRSIYQFNPVVKDRDKMLFLKHYIFILLEKGNLEKVIQTLYQYELVPSVLDTLLRIKEVGDAWAGKEKAWKKIFNAKFQKKLQTQFEEYELVEFKKHGTLPIAERYENRLNKTVCWNKDTGQFEQENLQLESF